MKLETYLTLSRTSRQEFAEAVDTSLSTVSRLISGKALPSWGLMDRIYAYTGGAVRPNDFMPTVPQSVGFSADPLRTAQN